MYKRVFPFVLGFFVLSADSIAKYLTNAYLPLMRPNWLWYPYGGIGIFKNFLGIEFSLSHQINHGAAWGILADYQISLLYLRIVLIAFLFFYIVFFNKKPERNTPLVLIIAGATSNVIDYFLYGHVVDMLHFVLWGYDFPVFNLADSAIFIGVAYLLGQSLLKSYNIPKKKVRRN